MMSCSGGKSRNASGTLRDLSPSSCKEEYVWSKDISFAWLNVYDRLSKSISKNPNFMTHSLITSLCLKSHRTYQCLKLNILQQAHKESCQYGDAQCAACGETMERGHLKRHRENDCVNRAVACAYCGGEVRQSNMKVWNCMCWCSAAGNLHKQSLTPLWSAPLFTYENIYCPAPPSKWKTTIPRIYTPYTYLCLLPGEKGANLLRDAPAKFVNLLILDSQFNFERLSTYKYECWIKPVKRPNNNGHEEHKRIL